MQSFRLAFLIRCVLVALPLAMAACADFDLFEEKKTPLAGDRKQLFPAGVPGVNYNEPPMQPTNSNIPVNTQVSGTALGQNPPPAQENEQPPSRAKSRTARNTPQNQPRPEPPPAATPDPWGDTRAPN